MGRLFELIVCGVFLWLALESWVARISGRGGRASRGPRRATRGAAPAPRPQAAAPRSPADLTLVRCAACGTHVPQSRTVAAGGARYCSERCAGGAAEKAGTARAGERAG
jgi:Prokaryotic metallothionein